MGHFLLFYAPLPFSLKPEKLESLKKTAGDIIVLHLCAINDNHMMYGSYNIEHDRHNYFISLTHFLPFQFTNNPENQSFEKMKKKAPMMYGS